MSVHVNSRRIKRKVTGSAAISVKAKLTQEPLTLPVDGSSPSDGSSEHDDANEETQYDHFRDGIRRCLQGDLALHGDFAYTRLYDAPIPILTLADLGAIGLPLTPREADYIKTRCTAVGPDNATWEMEPSKVKFANPAWNAWLEGAVQTACKALGVDPAASRPKAELRKLTLQGTGSHWSPCADHRADDNAFATVTLLLPSTFTGGEVHISHEGEAKKFDAGGLNTMKTCMLAWHSDVSHELKPITSGYRLALSFGIIHTTSTPRPTLSTANQNVLHLRRLLLSWSQDPASSPEKIIWLLDHLYSREKLSSTQLKDRDARVFSILDRLAINLGMCIGLVNVEHKQQGPGFDPLLDDMWQNGEWDDAYDEDENSPYIEMEEVEEETTTLTRLVSVKGKLIHATLDFDDEKETIPCLKDFIPANTSYEQKWEHTGDCSGVVERYYHRTALIMWPCWGKLGGRKGANRRCGVGLSRIGSSVSVQPTQKETEFLAYIFEHSQDLVKGLALKVLCGASRRWRDRECWKKSLGACAGGKSGDLSLDEVKAASESFGFPSLMSAIQQYITHDPSNSSRLEYLSQLSEWAKTSENALLQQEIVAFVTDTRHQLFLSIQPPTAAEVELLVREAETLSVIHGSLVPQIVKIASAKVQEAFATHIQEVSSILVQSPTDTKLIRPILEDLLAGQVSKTNFFRSVEVRQTYDSDDDEYMATLVKPKSKSPHGSPKIALSIMKKCVDSGHPHLAAAAITHMLKMDAVSSPVAQARAKTVLLPLVPLLLVEPQILAALPTELFNDLKRTSVELSLDEIHRYGGKITRSELAQILDVAEHSETNVETSVRVERADQQAQHTLPLFV